MNIPRIAYCSPVNPAPSGISDYSEELLPYLGQYAHITLFVDDSLRPDNPDLTRHLDVQPIRRLERMHRRTPFDALIYHMGNSPAHASIWHAAQHLPGVIVLHDFVLHHFMLWYAANREHTIENYIQRMSKHYGAPGEHVAQLMIRGRFTEAAFDFPASEPVISAAYGLIAHNHYVKERVASIRPTVPVAVIPMGIPLPPDIDRTEARNVLGLPDDIFIVTSFGHINAYKRLDSVFQALHELRDSYPSLRYILVGSVSSNYDVHSMIERAGLTDNVQVTGYVPHHTFEYYVAAADVCINLRYPTAGETSASLLRLLGAGRPTLVSSIGSFAELPPDVAAQIDVDPNERDMIVAHCKLFIQRPDIAAALSSRARRYVAENHTLERAAQLYVLFLARLYGWEAVVRIRPQPLWNVTPKQVVQQPIGKPHTKHKPSATQAQNEIYTPERPDIHTLPEKLAHLSLSEIAQILVDMGITEHNETLLHSIAERIWELHNT